MKNQPHILKNVTGYLIAEHSNGWDKNSAYAHGKVSLYITGGRQENSVLPYEYAEVTIESVMGSFESVAKPDYIDFGDNKHVVCFECKDTDITITPIQAKPQSDLEARKGLFLQLIDLSNQVKLDSVDGSPEMIAQRDVKLLNESVKSGVASCIYTGNYYFEECAALDKFCYYTGNRNKSRYSRYADNLTAKVIMMLREEEMLIDPKR